MPFRNPDLSGLTLLEPVPDSAFVQVHKPRGSGVVDAFWSRKKWPKDVQRELGEFDAQAASLVNFSSGGRPASAVNSTRRPISALGTRRERPGTAPVARKRPQRPPSASGFPWDASEIGSGPVFFTKSAKELREEVGAKRTHNAKFDLKHLMTKTGEDAHDLCLSQASTDEGGDDKNDGGDSDDSELEDEERLARAFRRVERFEQIAETATMLANGLKEENEQHVLEIEQLNGTLSEYEEKFEMLSEAEARWREKNSKLRDRDAVHCANLERARMNRCDLEDRTRPLDLHMNLMRKKLRRWGLSFDRLSDRIVEQRRMEELGLLWQAWRQECEKSLLTKSLLAGTTVEKMKETAEKAANQDHLIAELQEQVEEIPRLQEQLKQAHTDFSKLKVSKSAVVNYAFRGTTAKAIIMMAWKSWVDALPTLRLEREHVELKRELEELKDNYIALHLQLLALQKSVDDDVRLKALQELLTIAVNRQGVLEADVELTSQRSSARLETIQSERLQNRTEMQDVKEGRDAMEVALKTEIAEVNEAWQQRYSAAVREHAMEGARLRADIDELEARQDDLLEALHLEGDAGGDGRSTRLPRVVPRSKGNLCAGCLTQILHRDVRPLQSAAEMKEGDHLEREKATVFENTVGGPDPNQSAHAFLWQRRKDPPKMFLEGGTPSPTGKRAMAIRPHSAAGRSCRSGGKAGALREEIAGFRNAWRG